LTSLVTKTQDVVGWRLPGRCAESRARVVLVIRGPIVSCAGELGGSTVGRRRFPLPRVRDQAITTLARGPFRLRPDVLARCQSA